MSLDKKSHKIEDATTVVVREEEANEEAVAMESLRENTVSEQPTLVKPPKSGKPKQATPSPANPDSKANKETESQQKTELEETVQVEHSTTEEKKTESEIDDAPTESNTIGSRKTHAKTLHQQRTQVRPEQNKLTQDEILTQITGPKSSSDENKTELAATIATSKRQPKSVPKTLSSDDEIVEGSILRGRFILDKRLGAGGMGQVFLARDLRREEMHDNTLVAIKFLSPKLSSNAYDHHMFLVALQREAKKAQTLAHPNIVTVFDFDRDGDIAFISMEYLKGKALNEYLGKKRRLSIEQAMHITERVARGLAYAHQEGYVHADIKPPNVFITEDGQVKILDFGIAQAIQNKQSGENTAVQTHTNDDVSIHALTPMYSSVEVLQGQKPLPDDDVFALCCTTYKLLTNRPPYTDENGRPLTAEQARALGVKIKPIPDLSRRHMRALRKGLAFERKDRFRNAGDFIDAIKPRSWKKDLGMTILAVAFVAAAIIAWVAWLPDKPVTLEDLDPALAEVRTTIEEGDALLEANDIDLAHRLYSQAWDTSVEMPELTSDSLNTLNALLNQRADRIADKLILAAGEENMDEFRIRQLQLALEFLETDTLGTKDEEIKQTLDKLNEKLEKLQR